MKQKKSDTGNLRIVWICHFMNQSIKEKLALPVDQKELAPWITLGIEEFRKRNDIELHVIAPLHTILKYTRINEGNIHYHFVKFGVPYMRRKWPWWLNLDVWSNFLPFNIRVKRLIAGINPDLINLIGAENAYYSSSALKIKGYPILITIQGFITLNNEAETGDPRVVGRRIFVEEEILRKMKHFGIEATSMEKYIRTYNPAAKMHWFHLPFAKTTVDIIPDKEYDLVFFARITKMKGIEDAIHALSKAKHYRPDISMEVIGNADETYKNSLQKLVDDLDLRMNITFKGFIPTQREMHNEVLKARISVLPTYNDTIPGTIVESLLLGIPVITYKTGGIPDLNKDDENLILVEQGDIDRLAAEVVKLLNDPERQKKIGTKTKSFASAEFNNTNSTDMLVKAYKEVIQDYNN